LVHSVGEIWARQADLVQGTLDMLILKTLARGTFHGYAIAEAIHESSDDVLRVEEGALIRRCIGWSCAGCSPPNGAPAKIIAAPIYRLTAAGRKVLDAELAHWKRMVAAIGRVIQTA